MRIERILCPTDLTAESEAALRYASTLARAYEAQLILMYCQPDSPDKSDATVPNAAELLEQTWRWQSKIVNCDDPTDCITREASRYGADLIVMRSRRRPHRAALLGSVAESVSRTAPCPVMVIHSDERDWIEGDGRQIG